VVHIDYLAVVVSAVAVFVFAAVYYIVLAGPRARLSSAALEARPSPRVMALEVAKNLVLAVVIAGLVATAGVAGVAGALLLALALWLAFPVLLLAGSVTHEKVPMGLAAIHAGDWLAKLAIISVVVTLWR
jgi:hypothetical protein